MQDYERQEKEEIQAFLKKLSEGKFQRNERFPSEHRFKNLHFPITYRGEQGIPIWPLIPFSGSTIIPLMPIQRENFESFHQFQISQIEQMVSFSEETGKIQFVLLRNPTEYKKLDFLEPIFKRLRPPQFLGIPVTEFAGRDVLDKYYEEFQLIANSGFRDSVRKSYPYSSNKGAFKLIMNNVCGNYMMIRAITAPYISNDFAETFAFNYVKGMEMMNLFDIMVLRPLRNPLRCMDAQSSDILAKAYHFGAQQGIEPPDKIFPCEVGKLLMRKLTYYPESFEACKQLVVKYDDLDVIKLFNALNEGISLSDPDIVKKTEHELSVTLDDVWKNKSFQNKIIGVRFGVPLILGAIGTVAAGLSGAYVGLLSGLGFDAIDRLLEFKGEIFSETISKSLSPSYQAIIFDFQKKYSLKS